MVGAVVAVICAAGSNNLFEKTLAEIMAPKAEQSVLLGEKLLKHLGTEYYLTTHIFPVFDLPFRLDANNEVIDLSYSNNTVINKILHKSDNPPRNKEPFVTHVKEFMCERWFMIINEKTNASYVFVDEFGNEYLSVVAGNEDCPESY